MRPMAENVSVPRDVWNNVIAAIRTISAKYPAVTATHVASTTRSTQLRNLLKLSSMRTPPPQHLRSWGEDATMQALVKLCESRPAFEWSNYRDGLDEDTAFAFLIDDFVALDTALASILAPTVGRAEALEASAKAFVEKVEALVLS